MEFLYLYLCMQDKYNIVNNDLRITESEPSKMLEVDAVRFPASVSQVHHRISS